MAQGAEENEIAKQIERVAAATDVSPPDDKAKLELGKYYRQQRRDETMRSVIHAVLIIAVSLVGLVIVGVLTIRIVFLVLPSKWQWLSEDQITQIDHFLFSGFIGGVLTQAGRKIIGSYKGSNESDSDE